MLVPPSLWPPPDYETWVTEYQARFSLSRFTIVRWFQQWCRTNEFRYGCLTSIENELIVQIVNRPPPDMAHLTSVQRKILQILANAVKDEKGIPTVPPIYLDDPLGLLMWGVDDLTPLIFKLEFQRRFRVRVDSDRMWEEIIRPGATVGDLLVFLLSVLRGSP